MSTPHKPTGGKSSPGVPKKTTPKKTVPKKTPTKTSPETAHVKAQTAHVKAQTAHVRATTAKDRSDRQERDRQARAKAKRPSDLKKVHQSSQAIVGTPSEMSGKRLFLMAFFTSCALISWQEVKTFKRLPLPSRFVGAGVAFGLLAISEPIISPQLAGSLAWGLVMGLAYQQNSHAKIEAKIPNGVVPIPLEFGSSGAMDEGAAPNKIGGKKP